MRSITFLRRDGQERGVDGEVRKWTLRYSLYHGLMVVRVVSIGILSPHYEGHMACHVFIFYTATIHCYS